MDAGRCAPGGAGGDRGRRVAAQVRLAAATLEADTLLMSGGLTTSVDLLMQAGGKLDRGAPRGQRALRHDSVGTGIAHNDGVTLRLAEDRSIVSASPSHVDGVRLPLGDARSGAFWASSISGGYPARLASIF
ncbi:MAG TPA: hypothetical protein VIN05_15735 [Roseovarius sp.]